MAGRDRRAAGALAKTAQSAAFVPLVMFLADRMPFVSGSDGACSMMGAVTVEAPRIHPVAAPDAFPHYPHP